MEENDWTAWIMGDEDLELVDLRTVDTRRLRKLRSEAGSVGDLDMVETIDAILRGES